MIDFETLLQQLRDATGEVELDLPPSLTSSSLTTASRHAAERRAAISRGMRAASLFPIVPGAKPETTNGARAAPKMEILVDPQQALQLLAAGARWVGPASHAPEPPVAASRMIQTFRLSNFKGHADTTLELGRFTMLVGDNASGKTSVLEALHLQAALARTPAGSLEDDRAPRDLQRRGSGLSLKLESTGTVDATSWRASITIKPTTADDSWHADATGARADTPFTAQSRGNRGGGSAGGSWDEFCQTVGSAGLYRFRADVIAAASYSELVEPTVESDGGNTAVVLAAMKLGNDEAFGIVEEALRRLVPAIERIRPQRATVYRPSERGGAMQPFVGSRLHFDFRGAPDVPAHGASHGTLIALALLAVLYGPRRPNLILLDDLDHALHPRAQRELVQLIRRLLELREFSDLQIVATTHSPYVLDGFDPKDVYAFALRDDGTVASKRLSEHPDAEAMKGSLTTGQLWSLDEERSWVIDR